jgi:hypothetical protein
MIDKPCNTAGGTHDAASTTNLYSARLIAVGCLSFSWSLRAVPRWGSQEKVTAD